MEGRTSRSHMCSTRKAHVDGLTGTHERRVTRTKNTRNGRDKSRTPVPMVSGGRFINGVGLLEIKIIVGVHRVDEARPQNSTRVSERRRYVSSSFRTLYYGRETILINTSENQR